MKFASRCECSSVSRPDTVSWNALHHAADCTVLITDVGENNTALDCVFWRSSAERHRYACTVQ